MMKGILTIAQKEVKSAFRDKIFMIIVGLFVVLSVVSVYIGSSTKNALLQAYQDIVNLLKTQGTTTFPAPPVIFPLSILHNIINYVSMIGAVVAIFLGFEAFSGERDNGTLKLIAARPVYRDQIVTGKLLGGGMVIGLLLGVILIFNLALFGLVAGLTPSLNEIGKLILFFIFAFLYMMLFYTATLFVSIKVSDSAYGFMLMMIVWIAASFVLPQMAESQKSFAYALNSTAQTVTQLPTDTATSKIIEGFSPTAHFQNIGEDFMEVIPETAAMSIAGILYRNMMAIVSILLLELALLLVSYRAVRKEGVV